jgi:hypothetical protein
VDSSISRRYGGFGLGLSIVQELVRAHGGDITVRQLGHSGEAYLAACCVCCLAAMSTCCVLHAASLFGTWVVCTSGHHTR